MKRSPAVFALLGLCALAALAAPHAARAEEPKGEAASEYSLLTGWRPVAGVSIASRHFGAERDFEEFNPGVSFGIARDMFWLGGEWGLEGGLFRNSYGERAFYAGAWADWAILGAPEAAEFRLGAFFAFAEYDQLVDEAKDAGAPTFGDFVPLVAAQASVRYLDRYALVARFGPGIDDSDVIVGLQAMYFF